ncbi:hypothetical protein [Spartinivicinus poritis]|uniref:Uncharacterized protein n=1 Tax=Spartinivicinus poritis TaxID=2994640 RepID=A0ABT5UGJ9_9GAMM|nr:hypothetical protein [Spartinivicinus sp. A2-2]MDE1465519.1 hypothetical protein [Spartinivicinus sp. A2-2]
MSVANRQQRPKTIQKQGEQKLTRAQLHLEKQRNAYRVLEALRKLAEYNAFAKATFATLKSEGMRWLPYLAKTLKLSESDIKKLLMALEQFGYIRCLAGFVGNIKLLEKSEKAKGRVNLGGGYCGHENDSPIFEMARPINLGKRSPSLIINAVKRSTAYYSRPDLFPSLKYCKPHKKKKTKKGVSRRQYSQRRFACVVVMAALLKRMDIKTLQIVVSDKDGTFYHCKIAVLVNDTGLHPRRVERAMGDLRDAGLIDVLGRPTEKDEKGQFKAMPAIRAFNESFFGVLGLAVALREERKKRQKKEIKQNKKQLKKAAEAEEKPNVSAKHRMKLIFDANQKRQANTQQQLFDNSQRQQQKQNEHEQLAHKKQYLSKLSELYEAYKGEKDYQELKRLAKKLTGYTGD